MDLDKFNLVKLAYASRVEPILAAAPAASKMLLAQKGKEKIKKIYYSSPLPFFLISTKSKFWKFCY
jgi:hypothetical protein